MGNWLRDGYRRFNAQKALIPDSSHSKKQWLLSGIFRFYRKLKMLKNKFARLAVIFSATGAMANQAFAADGITSALAAVDLSGVATAVGAIALVVVAIALVFKGPDIAKRVIRKV